MPQSNISQIESGKRQEAFDSSTLLDIEQALDLFPGELMALMRDQVIEKSRESFIQRYAALLSDDDKIDLRRMSWFGPNEDPPDDAWMSVVHARRAVRAKTQQEKKTPT